MGQEWVEAMNACETLVSDQSFEGFQDYSAAPSKLNVEPQLERGFQHPNLNLNVSAISNGSEWFFCDVTGDTGTEQGFIIGTLTGTLLAQVRAYGDHSLAFEDGKTFAPVRVVCRGDRRLTSVFAYYHGEENEFRVAAIDRLPKGVGNPCRSKQTSDSN